MTPTTAAAMGSVPVDKAGVGSAVLNSMRQVGGSLGIALMGAIVAASVSVLPTNPAYPDQFVEGYHNALHVAARRSRSSAPSSPWRPSARSVTPNRKRSPRSRAHRPWRHACRGGTQGCGARLRLRDLLRRELPRDDDRPDRAQAGVTEPVLYRHFASKRDLYLAVLEESWRRLRIALGCGRRGRAGPAALGRRDGAGATSRRRTRRCAARTSGCRR